jgi:phosphoribosylformylglycinamidine synthase
VRRDQKLIVENNTTAWTKDFKQGEEIIIPLKNADGRFVADADTIKRIEDNGQVTFRYVGMNPNGSLDDIAGVSNEAGNVVGLMPHPEHAVEPGFGPDTAQAMRSGLDGLKFFTSVIQSTLLAKA